LGVRGGATNHAKHRFLERIPQIRVSFHGDASRNEPGSPSRSGAAQFEFFVYLSAEILELFQARQRLLDSFLAFDQVGSTLADDLLDVADLR
jgi:hypothetical protein